ncbi:glycerol-3-phosphate dehydrogenase [NAD(+)], partial [Haematococcus lacustris]
MATALDDERVQAIHCARKGHAVTLWALEQEVVDSLNGPEHENLMYFKGHKVSHRI